MKPLFERVDPMQVQDDVLSLLMERGPMTSGEITRHMKRRDRNRFIMQALRYLQGKKIIDRATNREPWAVIGQKNG
jgi:hypothetical protein